MVQPQKGRPIKNMEKRGRRENLTHAGKGRPKGTLNKFTSFKASLLNVYQGMGGDKAMLEWAMRRENQGEFYKLVAKLLPKEVELAGKDGGPLQIQLISYKALDDNNPS